MAILLGALCSVLLWQVNGHGTLARAGGQPLSITSDENIARGHRAHGKKRKALVQVGAMSELHRFGEGSSAAESVETRAQDEMLAIRTKIAPQPNEDKVDASQVRPSGEHGKDEIVMRVKADGTVETEDEALLSTTLDEAHVRDPSANDAKRHILIEVGASGELNRLGEETSVAESVLETLEQDEVKGIRTKNTPEPNKDGVDVRQGIQSGEHGEHEIVTRVRERRQVDERGATPADGTGATAGGKLPPPTVDEAHVVREPKILMEVGASGELHRLEAGTSAAERDLETLEQDAVVVRERQQVDATGATSADGTGATADGKLSRDHAAKPNVLIEVGADGELHRLEKGTPAAESVLETVKQDKTKDIRTKIAPEPNKDAVEGLPSGEHEEGEAVMRVRPRVEHGEDEVVMRTRYPKRQPLEDEELSSVASEGQ